MASDEKDEKWGTIFIDSKRESTLSQLDAMQAASRQEQWNQRTQQDYMEKVRAKAVERAREILGEAYTERQKVLEEAEADAENIRNEALKIKNNAETIRNEAQDLKHDVQAELDKALHMQSTAQEDGFQAGLKQAQEELDSFRLNMGASVGGVLKAIEDQSLNIFAAWRAELVALLKVCVEKGTGLALDERYNKILENLVIEAVRNLDDRRHVTLRVHPDDEAVMSDIFAAAKEKMPDLGQWAIESDPSLEVGGLMAESSSGTVDSRLELFKEMVDNILEHLVLPESELDSIGVEFVEKISKLEQENLEQIVEYKSRPPKEELAPTEPALIEPEMEQAPEEPINTEEATLDALPDDLPEDLPDVQNEPILNTESAESLDDAEAQENTNPAEVDLTANNDELSDAESIVDDVLPQDEMLVTPQVSDDTANLEPENPVQVDLESDAQVSDIDTEQEPELEQEADAEPELKPSAEELSRLELEEELLPLPQDTEDKA